MGLGLVTPVHYSDPSHDPTYGGTTTISVLPQLPEYMPEADLDQAVGTESSWPEQLLVIDFSTNDSVLRTGLDAASQARCHLLSIAPCVDAHAERSPPWISVAPACC